MRTKPCNFCFSPSFCRIQVQFLMYLHMFKPVLYKYMPVKFIICVQFTSSVYIYSWGYHNPALRTPVAITSSESNYSIEITIQSETSLKLDISSQEHLLSPFLVIFSESLCLEMKELSYIFLL